MARTKKVRRTKNEILLSILFPEPFLISPIPEDVDETTILSRGSWKYSTFVDGGNGYLYGIPAAAQHVLKLDPLRKTFTQIGLDLGKGIFPFSWRCGILASNGYIYCPPSSAENYTNNNMVRFLKISTVNDDDVTILSIPPLPDMHPENYTGPSWRSGVLANDGQMYFMPSSARKILQFNPNMETICSVGEDLGDDDITSRFEGTRYSGTVMGTDGCIYGIPYEAKRIIKFDPSTPDSISFIRREVESHQEEEELECGNGVLGGDGCIYAANHEGQILKIDVNANHYKWINKGIQQGGCGWGDPIVGMDKCIYWPPDGADYVLKFDPTMTPQKPPSLESSGGFLGNYYTCHLGGGVSASNGVMYCPPYEGDHILVIDPWNEFSALLKKRLYQYPTEFGRLFAKDTSGNDDECDDETFYEAAVRKFGIHKFFTLLDQLLPYCSSSNSSSETYIMAEDDVYNDCANTSIKVLQKKINIKHDNPLFIIAASSCKYGHNVDMVYHFLRRDVQALLIYAGIIQSCNQKSE